MIYRYISLELKHPKLKYGLKPVVDFLSTAVGEVFGFLNYVMKFLSSIYVSKILRASLSPPFISFVGSSFYALNSVISGISLYH